VTTRAAASTQRSRRPHPVRPEVRVVVESAQVDDPETVERVVRALARLLAPGVRRRGQAVAAPAPVDRPAVARAGQPKESLKNLITLCSHCHREWTHDAEGVIPWMAWLRCPARATVLAAFVLGGKPDTTIGEVLDTLAAVRALLDAGVDPWPKESKDGEVAT
jgi:hypothetical protein